MELVINTQKFPYIFILYTVVMFRKLWNNRIGPNAKEEDLKKYAYLSDKYEVKKHLKQQNIPELHYTKTIGVYDHFEQIDIEQLPEQFVIKVNHWCGDVTIVKSKQEFKQKYEKLRQYYNTILKRVYRNGAEPHYKYIPPKLFIEEYLGDDIIDYKIHCIWGKPVVIMAMNLKQHIFYNYTIDWKRLNIIRGKNGMTELPKPKDLNKLLEVSQQLSKEHDYVRVDLYNINSNIYFGELTFTPGGCQSPYFRPYEFEQLLDRFYTTKRIDYDEINKYTV